MLYFKSTNEENIVRVNLEQVTCYTASQENLRITFWFAGDNENQVAYRYDSVESFKLDFNLLDEVVGLKQKEK